MGNEIAKLKNENKRTKTSIQRMKSFQNQQRKARAAQMRLGGEALAPGDGFPGQDCAMLDKMGRLIARESYSKCDSDRRHGFAAVDYS